jgi:hypothetical protein
MTTPDNNSDNDANLMNELRINDERLTKEMFDAALSSTEMLNVLTKKQVEVEYLMVLILHSFVH